MNRPGLKQFLELTRDDFQEHPLWVNCHVLDYDEPWYDDTDEETFRPWTGAVPTDPEAEMFLIRASALTRDRTKLHAFLTPAKDPSDMGLIQPHVFAGDQSFGFWGGMIGIPETERQQLLSTLRKDTNGVFPIRFIPEPLFDAAASEIVIRGWL